MHLRMLAHRWCKAFQGVCSVKSDSSLHPSLSVFVHARVLRDVEAVRQEALLLREQMLVVKEDIKRVCLSVHC